MTTTKTTSSTFPELFTGYTHLSQIRFVRQPMRVGGLWECEVAV